MGVVPLRAIGLLVVFVLAGGPAVKAACEAYCSHDHVGSAAVDSAHEGHHAAAPDEHAHAAAALGRSMPDRTSLATLQGHECCAPLEQHLATLASSRAHTSWHQAPPGLVASAAAVFVRLAHRFDASRHGSPPGTLSLTRSPFVLRV